ncbi:GMC oxidoreductase-like protein [Schizothecium vesticola]|uniref:GMC oxidoreductase-like protein n=1 Tax=Schizothecium vesticola TaxID=314040 RepID=A0AA40BTC2_9PEZI|nr:GMC oxidoreductase-like protein [Schizothecium vesticola]
MSLVRVVFLSLAILAGATGQYGYTERQTLQLRSSYDFVIVGAGTSGLTIADRLSQALPSKTVLVVEYGKIEYCPGPFDPPTNWLEPADSASRWVFNSLPSPEMKNKTAFVTVGQVVGGSSCINGMFFDRGSRFDYDAWTDAGGPEFARSDVKWNWKGLFPYFKKSVKFTKPSHSAAQKYGYTWDESAYGGSTDISSSYPPFQWADQPVLRDGWKEMGIKPVKECAGGDKEGICWVPTSQNPVTGRRSHAGIGHYANVLPRANYDLLVNHQAIRVVYPKGPQSGPPVLEVLARADGTIFNITAQAEVIISAGALHTPTILQRSGIGPASFLLTANIPLVLNLPGVGSNLQDHSGPPVNFNYTDFPSSLFPVPSSMLNATFKADAIAGFNETPARGPYTLSLGNSAIYVSLPHMSPKYATIISKIRKAVSSGIAASYLPSEYQSIPAMVSGYNAQLLTLADLLSNPEAPNLESPWATSNISPATTVWSFLLHPLSRGTVRLNLTSPLAQPLLDYRMGSNPIDFDLHTTGVRFLRTLLDTPAMKKYGATEVSPGAAVAGNETALVEYVKDQIILSFQHPCCTAPMLPKDRGGVVGTDLKVHGAKGLRVADMSVSPLLVGSHLSATAYAVGEKAADIIIGQWKGH